MNGDEAPQTAFSGGVTLTEGPFAGWTTWSGGSDPYETHIGPFYFRQEDGQARCVFEPQRRHLNGGGAIHGGCLMSFASFSLFAIAHNALRDTHAVTMPSSTPSSSALAPWMDGSKRGEIIRDTRSVVLVRKM